jgi:hypothetical protein
MNRNLYETRMFYASLRNDRTQDTEKEHADDDDHIVIMEVYYAWDL